MRAPRGVHVLRSKRRLRRQRSAVTRRVAALRLGHLAKPVREELLVAAKARGAELVAQREHVGVLGEPRLHEQHRVREPDRAAAFAALDGDQRRAAIHWARAQLGPRREQTVKHRPVVARAVVREDRQRRLLGLDAAREPRHEPLVALVALPKELDLFALSVVVAEPLADKLTRNVVTPEHPVGVTESQVKPDQKRLVVRGVGLDVEEPVLVLRFVGRCVPRWLDRAQVLGGRVLLAVAALRSTAYVRPRLLLDTDDARHRLLATLAVELALARRLGFVLGPLRRHREQFDTHTGLGVVDRLPCDLCSTATRTTQVLVVALLGLEPALAALARDRAVVPRERQFWRPAPSALAIEAALALVPREILVRLQTNATQHAVVAERRARGVGVGNQVHVLGPGCVVQKHDGTLAGIEVGGLNRERLARLVGLEAYAKPAPVLAGQHDDQRLQVVVQAHDVLERELERQLPPVNRQCQSFGLLRKLGPRPKIASSRGRFPQRLLGRGFGFVGARDFAAVLHVVELQQSAPVPTEPPRERQRVEQTQVVALVFDRPDRVGVVFVPGIN